ncbi:MAG: type IV pilus modification PilV family protein [Neptuniibacter sp.]
MNFYHIRRDAGFTLIEVLIALVVAVIGILAMIQLSGIFLKTVADSEQRTVAYAVAEQTIENLRSFDSLSGSTAGESYFVDISSSTASLTVASGLASYDFDIAWTIADNIVASSALTPGASGAVYRTLKQVDVVVSWELPEAGSVSLSSYIGGIDPNAAALTVDNISNIGGDSPDVGYTPGVAPEVIAVDVADGKLKETTKPLPEVTNKSQSTQVRFETITYTNTNTEIQLIQEDFVTVNCRCVLNTSGGTVTTPAYQRFEDADTPLTEVLGTSVSGATGTEATLGGGKVQSEFCGRCCANHHDTNSSSVKYSPQANAASTGSSNTLSHGVDHPHYTLTVSGGVLTYTEAVHNSEYVEACRFKRIDGIYRLIQDWDLREVNVFPRAYLDSSSSAALADYVEYIKDLVKHEIFHEDIPLASVAASVLASTAEPTLTSVPSLTLTSTGNDESISRSIYLDNILSVEGLADYLLTLSAASVAEDTWLEFVPFNEINTTQLTKWNSTSTAIATVTDQPVAETYSRGHIYAVGLGAASVAASAAQGNTGILGNTYNAENIYPDEDNRITPTRTWLTGTYNPMPVTVSGAGGSPSVYSLTVSGTVTEHGGNVNYTLACTDSNYTTSLTETGNDFICTVSDIPTGVSANVTVTISSNKLICTPASSPYSYTYNTNANVSGVSFEVAKNTCSPPG